MSRLSKPICFPEKTDRLATAGRSYSDYRHQFMSSRHIGLRDTYNLFHDPDEAAPDVQQLREQHIEMDEAVAAGYGWSYPDLGHGFHETKQGLRFTISESIRHNVTNNLIELNRDRYEEEVHEGLHEVARKGKQGELESRAGREQ